MLRSKLLEGMWSGDLADLVQPLVSIDEYKSKIDISAIAIGFYVTDKDAAGDLNRFIQKSPVSLIDTDVSPAPDQRGYYLVFVEIENNDRLVSSITSVLDEVGALASIDSWKMKVRNQKEMLPYDQEKLGGFLQKNRIQDEVLALKIQIDEFKKQRRDAKLAKAKQKKEAEQKVKDATAKREADAKKRAEKSVKKDKPSPKPSEKGEVKKPSGDKPDAVPSDMP